MFTESKLPSFLVVIYCYRPTGSWGFFRQKQSRKHILFASIIQSASIEEARKEAVSNFWEQRTPTRRRSDPKRDASGYLKKPLPDDCYFDGCICHSHKIAQVWEKIFIDMGGFHTMDRFFEKLCITRSGTLHRSKRDT